MRNQGKSTRTGQLYKKGSTFHWTTPLLITIKFFVFPIRIWMSSLSVSLLNQIENFGWVETSFDLGKRLLTTRRVLSRPRGTRTILYTHWGCQCVRIGEHQHRERMPSGVVFWTGLDRDVVVIVRQSERIKDFSKEAEGRPKGVVELRERGTDKVSQSDTE